MEPESPSPFKESPLNFSRTSSMIMTAPTVAPVAEDMTWCESFLLCIKRSTPTIMTMIFF